jgi:hypothetical protein
MKLANEVIILLMLSEIVWLLVSTTDLVLLVFMTTLPNDNVALENVTGLVVAAEVLNPASSINPRSCEAHRMAARSLARR